MMDIKRSIRRTILVFLSVIFLIGCTSNSKSENQELKQQLNTANEKIKTQNELYDLRNILDAEVHRMIIEAYKGNIGYFKDKITNNITMTNNKIISNAISNRVKVEIDIPKERFDIRQRAYMFSDDKKEFSSIYEIYPIVDNSLKTIHVYFILDNGNWKLNYIGKDE
jgi:hypothetical protein